MCYKLLINIAFILVPLLFISTLRTIFLQPISQRCPWVVKSSDLKSDHILKHISYLTFGEIMIGNSQSKIKCKKKNY